MYGWIYLDENDLALEVGTLGHFSPMTVVWRLCVYVTGPRCENGDLEEKGNPDGTVTFCLPTDLPTYVTAYRGWAAMGLFVALLTVMAACLFACVPVFVEILKGSLKYLKTDGLHTCTYRGSKYTARYDNSYCSEGVELVFSHIVLSICIFVNL